MTITYLDLSPAQRTSLDTLPFDGNHLVSGPPGSGKSLLAAQRALMLALTGTPTVLLTRSNLLRQTIAPVVSALGTEDHGVRVSTAHAWLAQWFGGDAPKTDDGWFDWAGFYERAAIADPGPALMVDEGQDLPVGFYRLCRILGSRTTVYADECQRLTETNSTVAEIVGALGQCTSHTLAGNHRNTRQIAELAARFHTGATAPPLPDREGPTPRLHRLDHPGAVTDLLIALAERHSRRSIGVILSSAHAQFDVLTRLERKAPRLQPQLYTSQATHGRYRTIDFTRPGIVIVNRASAKGLEFDTVVIPDTHADGAADPTSATLRMTYYVLATRARQELHFGYAGDTETPLLASLREGLLLRR
ncbi:DNA helicase [Kitasatospora aureofaciens]|uniref:DNA helicase n=1 Tax=Kitasatospora aureofaciens TaxID=1894 RepID=UPI001C47CAA0|nr:DNA helicase [Kitasatospora aureofaciens]MBV6695902.1 DNA helicase [Kitasatospora aureofaciens]